MGIRMNIAHGPSEELAFPSNYIIHSPAYSGVKITSEMGECANTLYESPGPFIVFEADKKFFGITWEPWNPRIGHTKPFIKILKGKWHITFPAGSVVRQYPKADSLKKAAEYYRKDHIMPLPAGIDVLKRIKRNVYLDLWLGDGRIIHDYNDACVLLNELDRKGVAEGTLLYMCGWHAPYDSMMPAWKPADALGGHKKFRELVNLSKSVGSIVMPHLNFWGYDANSGLLENWEEAWTKARWAGTTGLGPGNPIEYMQIDNPRWIKLFDDYFDKIVSAYALEAIFLDQCGNAMDSEKGDMVKATRALLDRIHNKFPNLLLGAEVLSEHIVDHVPLIQSTWLMEKNIGKFSPVARYMFEGRVRFFPHLFLAASLPCRYVYTNMPLIVEHGYRKVFQLYQQNNKCLGGIPSVRLDYKRSGIDPLSMAVLCKSSGRISAKPQPVPQAM